MKLELTEVAHCLNLPINTIERWVRQGRMPIRRTGSVCIFKKVVLEKWAKKHHISFNLPPRANVESSTDEMDTVLEKTEDTLTAAIKRGGLYHITGESVSEILKTASGKIQDLSEEKRSILCEKLIEREQLVSTGIGKGIAIPHPRTPISDESSLPVIATFFLEQPVDFGAIDDQPVNILFVIICPSVQSHLQLLSMISFCVRKDSFVSFLNTHPEKDEFYSKISELEKELEKRR